MSPEIAQNMIFVLFGAAVFLGVEATYLAISKRTSYVRTVNTRLKLMGKSGDQHDVLVQLRRDRRIITQADALDSRGAPDPLRFFHYYPRNRKYHRIVNTFTTLILKNQ